jgi:hypothetical protein
MKKVLYLATLLFCAVFTSCEKEEVGSTNTEAMAGQWYVTVDAADASGNVVEGFEDLFGLGRVLMLTYNSSKNDPNEIIVDDLGNFWSFKVKVKCDQNNMSFSTTTSEANNLVADYEELGVTITGGKIIKGGGKQNNGSVADYIEFYVSFDDDDYPARYGYTNYKVSGVRYSGLAEND